jgi:hypothetical protein
MIKDKQRIIRLTHKGSGGQKGWIYSIEGIISTLPASQYKDPSLIVVSTNNQMAVVKEDK